MYAREYCPICECPPVRRWRCELAPFLVERVWGEARRRSWLAECGQCGLRYLEERLEDAEVLRLYEGYRGESYYQQRHRHEPWYTRAINQGLGNIQEQIEGRAERIRRLAQAAGRTLPFGAALDFGGDRGQYLTESLATDRWVFDLSGVDSCEGVRATKTWEEVPTGAFDLVMIAHVLEHVMDPLAVLRQAAEALRPGGVLYVEVPFERPRIGRGPHVGWPGRLPFLFHDFISTGLRVKAGFVPPFAMLKVSEHVQCYTIESLSKAVEQVGFRVSASGRDRAVWVGGVQGCP